MSGGYISCGEFNGEDKSGSAYSGVLADLQTLGSGRYAQLVEPLARDLANCEESVEIPQHVAASLLPVLREYRGVLEVELGDIRDPFEAIDHDEELGLDSSDAKWGQGTGWKYYCVLDLERALVRSISTGECVYIEFD